jgi:hypothetical protein
MVERDDEGLAGVISLALNNSMGLTIGLARMLLRKRFLTKSELVEILSDAIAPIEEHLGPQEGDTAVAAEVRKYAANLRHIASVTAAEK